MPINTTVLAGPRITKCSNELNSAEPVQLMSQNTEECIQQEFYLIFGHLMTSPYNCKSDTHATVHTSVTGTGSVEPLCT